MQAGNKNPATGLAALEARLAQDLEWLCLPPPDWTPDRKVGETDVSDVLIVGGGMCGLAAAGALKLVGIHKQRIVDRAPAGKEGPWVTFARMETLRSPKTLTGPCLGLPALTFRAWYEAQFGLDAWQALDKIPRAQWMDYLVWYKRVLGLNIDNGVTVRSIEAAPEGLLRVEMDTPHGAETAWARHVVLATGRDGGGAPQVPAMAAGISRRFLAHSAHDIDFEALRGKRVAVLGAGASAMDNAATALEAGAARLDLFIRRNDIPRVNKLTGVSSPGLAYGFANLSDAWKWRINHYAMVSQVPPPRSSTLRVSRHPHAHFHLGSPVEALEVRDNALQVRTPKGNYEIDFLIFGTGFTTDLTQRPELAAFHDAIKLWKDAVDLSGLDANRELANSPYLGEAFECLEKTPGACPALGHVHLFNYSALASLGKLSGDIPAVSIGAERLAQGIISALFDEDKEAHFAALQAYATPELYGDEWTDADLAPTTESAPVQESI